MEDVRLISGVGPKEKGTRWMNGWMDEWMNELMDEWMGWMDGWMDEWTM